MKDPMPASRKEDPVYMPTIGLEIHAELRTVSKMFCSCKNDPDEERPNLNICPICLGHPGTLPVLNMEAIKHVLKVGLAVGGTLADFTEWDRKNYFYPDIPKGYQLSQYKYPLVSGGTLSGVELERIHLEEDTARSTHDHDQGQAAVPIAAPAAQRPGLSLIDFNRSGVPLMELVTKPVIHDTAAAVRFAKELQLLLRYLHAGEANLEKGEMRIEANISVALADRPDPLKLGVKTEVKNLNSFRAVERAIEFEIERQSSLLEAGETVVQETRGWDDGKNETYSQRSKESSHDYRYFPDPDVPKLKLSEVREFSALALRAELLELPWAKRDRYKNDFGMTEKEVAVFIESPEIARYFESVISSFKDSPKKVKLATNYLLTDYLGLLKNQSAAENRENRSGQSADGRKRTGMISETRRVNVIPALSFSELISMTAAGDISSRGAKDLLALLFSDQKSSARPLAEKHGLLQKSDAADLVPAIQKVIADNPKAAAEYKAGKTASLQFLIGQAMRATKGAGNPEIVRKLLSENLRG